MGVQFASRILGCEVCLTLNYDQCYLLSLGQELSLFSAMVSGNGCLRAFYFINSLCCW